jgi:hypothetical protein
MTRAMKKSKPEFKDIEILKERQQLRILEQEIRIKAEFKELGDRLTGKQLRNTVEETLISNSGMALKLGFMAFNLIMDRIRERRNRKRK